MNSLLHMLRKTSMASRRLFIQAAILGVLLPSVVSADSQDVIDYREHIMNTLNEQAGALGQILAGVVPGDNTAAHLNTIAMTAQIALKAFEPKVQGGEAKPEVWLNWADFSKRMKEFAQKSAEAAAVAKLKRYDDPVLGEKIVDALSCKSCHDIYRNEKKK
jgi:cytochrome c556